MGWTEFTTVADSVAFGGSLWKACCCKCRSTQARIRPSEIRWGLVGRDVCQVGRIGAHQLCIGHDRESSSINESPYAPEKSLDLVVPSGFRARSERNGIDPGRAGIHPGPNERRRGRCVTAASNATLPMKAGAQRIPVGELHTALQTKVVDGQENALPLVKSNKLHEVQKFCSYTSHVWDCFTLVGNKRNWNALPEDLRQLATQIFDADALKQREAHAVLNKSLEAKFKSSGMQFNPVDAKPFREALQKANYYNDWQKKFGPKAWALLEKYSGKLA